MAWTLTNRNYPGIGNTNTPQHPTLFGIQFGGTGFGIRGQGNEMYWLKAADIPDRTINVGTIHWMNGEFHYVTRTTPAGKWSCEFYLFEDMAAHRFMDGWYRQCVDQEEGIIGRMSDYKKTATVFLLDTENSFRTLEFKMKGLIPEAIGGVAMDYQNDQPMSFKVQFSYESYELNYEV